LVPIDWFDQSFALALAEWKRASECFLEQPAG
jgi:hypothetical protein